VRPVKPSCGECGQPHPRCNGHRKLRNAEQEAERARRFGGRPNFEPRPPVLTLQPCMRQPKKGNPVCYLCGASAPQIAAAGQARQDTIRLHARLGVAVQVDDGESIQAMRNEAAANVAVLRQRVHQLTLDATTETVAGIYGYTYHVSGKATGEAKPHILVVMYWEACDRLAKLDEMCIKLGLRKREVELAEGTGAQIAAVMEAVLRRAGLDPKAVEVRSWVHSEIQALTP
jgi:hypothetical protein